jgi:hypothetical protein
MNIELESSAQISLACVPEVLFYPVWQNLSNFKVILYESGVQAVSSSMFDYIFSVDEKRTRAGT